MQNLIGRAEGFHDGKLFPTELHQAVIWNNDEGIANLAQLLDAGHGLAGTARALELEGAGDNAHGQRAHLLRDGSDYGCSARTGAAALAGGNEDHIGALQGVLDFGLVVFRGGLAHLRVSACAQSAGGLAADVELGIGIGENQRLGVGVYGDELDAL